MTTPWPLWVRWVLAVGLVGEWLLTAMVTWLYLGLGCLFASQTEPDTIANHPVAGLALVLLPVAAVLLAVQAHVPRPTVPLVLGLVVLLHLAFAGVLLGALPYPEAPECVGGD